MYTFELLFCLNNSHDAEQIGGTINNYLHSLRMNGQILGKEYILALDKNIIRSYVLVPARDSLNHKYSNKYVKEYYKELSSQGIKIEFKRIGKELDSADLCKCNTVDSYILYTYYTSLESPLRCGNCFGIIPLYKIPKTYDDEYYDIKCWETNYQSCDTLQMNCRVGEKFGMRQLSDINSSLNKDGIDICKRIMDLTQKDTYYFLYHYVMYPKKDKELNRKCPLCGGEWILENELFDKFNFKCDKCLLLSNMSHFL